MARIKIVGYVDVESFDDDLIDLDNADGLTAKGYDDLITDERGTGLKVADLGDIQVELIADLQGVDAQAIRDADNAAGR